MGSEWPRSTPGNMALPETDTSETYRASSVTHAQDVLVIIPAHNEALCIQRVVGEARLIHPDYDILVIDDGSSDETSAIARDAGAMVLSLCYNLGIGGAVRAGYRFACEHDYPIIARIDADGQHDPRQLQQMIDLVRNEEFDMVIGSRHVHENGYSPSVIHTIGVKFFAALVTVITRQRFTDTTSGFSVINRKCCEFLARSLPSDYPEIEGLLKVTRAGFSVKEMSVRMRPRLDGQSSIGLLDAFYYVFKVTLAILVGATRQRENPECLK